MKECKICGYKNEKNAEECILCRNKIPKKTSISSKIILMIFIMFPIGFAIYLISIFIFSILPDFSFDLETIFGTIIFGIVMLGGAYKLIKFAKNVFLLNKETINSNDDNDISNINSNKE